MEIEILLRVEVDVEAYAEKMGIPVAETPENFATEFLLMTDALTWHVTDSTVLQIESNRWPDVVQTILRRPQNGTGGGIPLTRGEVAMLFLDGYAGDHPNLLAVYSQGYGEGACWHGLTADDVLEDEDSAFVWSKWEPIELWPIGHESQLFNS